MLQWFLELLANKSIMLWVTLFLCGGLLLLFAWFYKRNDKKVLTAEDADWDIVLKRPGIKKPRSKEQGKKN